MKKNPLGKFLKYVLLFVVIVFLATIPKVVVKQMRAAGYSNPLAWVMSMIPENSKKIESEVDRFVDDYSKKLPLVIDAMTVMTNITRSAKILTMTYDIAQSSRRTGVARADRPQEFSWSYKAEIKGKVLDSIKENPGMRSILKDGYTLQYIYMTEDTKLFSFQITEDYL
ncbi:hypothetical protein [uncultured Desulfosarcina sp.]|uniref:hypothetical protein n=1 Tax=uncultured Desulfosarcina sp. TaxID=218289 RepID=UPI0029C827A8|nr:hypothetical protein [uncultured Desulfosarcina sp.]